MRGGELIGSGNNTCVYNPPIDCVDGEIPEGHVSRIVPTNSVEPEIQEQIKARISKLDPKYTKHFNLATNICKAKFKESDLTRPCTIETLSDIKVGDSEFWNMLTPLQDGDINNKDGSFYKDPETTGKAFKDLLHAIAEMNSYSVQVFHSDSHMGNVSWKGDTIVLHDWEKCTITDQEHLKSINGMPMRKIGDQEERGWGILGYHSGHRPMLKDYSSWVYPIAVIAMMDSYIGVFPRTHKELHIVHQILFRYWDILSLLGSVKTMYDTATLEYPTWINYILGKIGESFFNEFKEEFKHQNTYDEAALESRLMV